MSYPFVGEIRLFGFGYPPSGWLSCSGQLLGVNQNAALFSLLGTAYGGDGRTTFGLPNLQTRVAMGVGGGGGATYSLGETGGEAQHALTADETPPHTHSLNANNATSGAQASPAGASLGVASAGDSMTIYGTGSPTGALASQTVGAVGGQPHPNMMPYLTLNYCIALQGIFPSRG